MNTIIFKHSGAGSVPALPSHARRGAMAWGLLTAALGAGLLHAADAAADQPFGGIRQTFVLSGDAQRLALKGARGTYSAQTLKGTLDYPVKLTAKTLSVQDGPQWRYRLKGGVLVGGPYQGFAQPGITSDLARIAGTYTTTHGANNAGLMSIDLSGNYRWCNTSLLRQDGTCANGAKPTTGTIKVQGDGSLVFGGLLRGAYAAYRRGQATAIFPVAHNSLQLMALTQPHDAPKGQFVRHRSAATKKEPLLSITTRKSKSRKILRITGPTIWAGKHPYSVDQGIISIPSPNCAGGVCYAIYNNQLGIFNFPRFDNRTFIR